MALEYLHMCPDFKRPNKVVVLIFMEEDNDCRVIRFH